MCAKSKGLWFVLLPALLMGLSALTAGRGEAVPKTATQCFNEGRTCRDKCYKNYGECLDSGESGCKARERFCVDNCDTAEKDCVKNLEVAPKVPKTKVQPKVKPGGAETPETESPDVRPKGGIQRH